MPVTSLFVRGKRKMEIRGYEVRLMSRVSQSVRRICEAAV